MPRKALVAGINNYPRMQLTGCVKDATDIAALLETNDDGNTNFNVQLHTDIMQKEKLRKLLDDLFSGDDEVALFYFSGHGYIDKSGGYLVMPDYRNYDEGISMNDILVLANNSRVKHKIIILDCCYSGTIAAPVLNHAMISHINQGVTILTASSEDQPAVEKNGQGIFTGLLVEALKGGAADIVGHITPGSLYAYIERALGPWEQSPLFKANVSEFVCLRKAMPNIDISVLRKITEYFKDPAMPYALNPSYEYTNVPDTDYFDKEPYANADHVTIFKDLQKMHRVGLVEPINETYMYYAAMNSTGCKLTPLGIQYHRLVKKREI